MPEKIYSKSPFRANRHRAPGTFTRGAPSGRRAASFAFVILSLILLASCSARGEHSGATSSSKGTAAQTAHDRGGTAAGTQSAATSGGAPSGGVSGAAASPAGGGAAGATTSATAGTPAGKTAGASSPGAAAGSGAATPTGPYVSFVTGTVTGSRPEGDSAKLVSTPAKLRVADSIERGELLRSGKSSAAEVRIGSEFDIGIGEETTVRFDSVGGAGKGPDRLALHLEKGTLQIKAGSALIDGSLTGNSGSRGNGGRPLLLEVHTPLLFVSSRGGSFLLSAQPDNDRAAVGLGQAWVLPQSVVYSDLVGRLQDQTILKNLDSILSKAVPLSRNEELSVTASQLVNINRVGRAIRSQLEAVLAAKQPSTKESSAISSLTSRAAGELQTALGKPKPLTASLRQELNPASVTQPKMKTTSVTENGHSSNGDTSKTTQQSAQSAPGSDGTGQASPASSPSGAQTAQPADTTAAPRAPAAGQQTASTSQNGSAASNAPAGSATTSKISSTGNAAVGRAVLDALNRFFGTGGSTSGGASGNGSGNGSGTGSAQSSGSPTGGSSSGGFSGPTPPTPPTPPTAP